MRKQTLFTIAPHEPFLKKLADNILDGKLLNGWDLSNPFALSDVTIILPTKRARLTLANIFCDKLSGGALLPNIITFGDQSQEDIIFLPALDAKPLPNAISNIKRILMLAKLVEGWADNSPEINPQAAEIIALASSLAQIIDTCHIENIDHKKLKNITPINLAKNWQQTLDFLLIALDAWPKILEQENKIDAALLKNYQIIQQAKAAKEIYADKPVIAAGSTGSILATANFLKEITKLKRGVVVLPGLDVNLSDESLVSLSDIKSNPHGHNQYTLAKLLSYLEQKPNDVYELASSNNARSDIIHHSLALAQDTQKWGETRGEFEEKIDSAFKNISLICADNDEKQARAIALACLEGLNKKKSVGIISPDQNLARRISAELARFDIKVDDSAGTPIFHTRAGRFARQILAIAKNNFAPLDLIALLRNQYASFGLKRDEIAKRADLLEYSIFRSERIGDGLDGIRISLQKNLTGENKYAPIKLSEAEADRLDDLISKIDKAFTPLILLFKKKSFLVSSFASIFSQVILAIIAPDNQDRAIKDDMKILLDWLDDLKNQANDNNSPILNSFDIEASFKGLTSSISYRSIASYNNDVAIWGLLEARLLSPDLLIMAGLNETIWPSIADQGPFLSRNMAIEAGIEPAEKRIGQAAHDFEMAFGNENLILSYSKNIGTNPAQISRFLQRVFAFIGDEETKKCQIRGNIWLEQAQAIDFCLTPKPATRPAPCPKQELRPKSLSVTEIETLVRSPYDIYAKYVLNLKPLDNIGQLPDARDRGNIIHAIFEQFIVENIDVNSIDAYEKIMSFAKTHFSKLSSNPSLEIVWLARFEKIAKDFIKFEQSRDANIFKRNAESYGEWRLGDLNPSFTLRGKADRIDITKNQSLEILDFKTGYIPDPKDMKDFLAPQMLLEAAMAREGVFNDIAPMPVSALSYIKIGAGPKAFELIDFSIEKNTNLDEAIDEIVRRLSMQISTYLLSDKVPMSARIYPSAKQNFIGNYEHLARTGEWSSIDMIEDD